MFATSGAEIAYFAPVLRLCRRGQRPNELDASSRVLPAAQGNKCVRMPEWSQNLRPNVLVRGMKSFAKIFADFISQGCAKI